MTHTKLVVKGVTFVLREAKQTNEGNAAKNPKKTTKLSNRLVNETKTKKILGEFLVWCLYKFRKSIEEA